MCYMMQDGGIFLFSPQLPKWHLVHASPLVYGGGVFLFSCARKRSTKYCRQKNTSTRQLKRPETLLRFQSSVPNLEPSATSLTEAVVDRRGIGEGVMRDLMTIESILPYLATSALLLSVKEDTASALSVHIHP